MGMSPLNVCDLWHPEEAGGGHWTFQTPQTIAWQHPWKGSCWDAGCLELSRAFVSLLGWNYIQGKRLFLSVVTDLVQLKAWLNPGSTGDCISEKSWTKPQNTLWPSRTFGLDGVLEAVWVFWLQILFPERTLTCFNRLATHGLPEACGALVGLNLPLSVIPSSNSLIWKGNVRISH